MTFFVGFLVSHSWKVNIAIDTLSFYCRTAFHEWAPLPNDLARSTRYSMRLLSSLLARTGENGRPTRTTYGQHVTLMTITVADTNLKLLSRIVSTRHPMLLYSPRFGICSRFVHVDWSLGRRGATSTSARFLRTLLARIYAFLQGFLVHVCTPE